MPLNEVEPLPGYIRGGVTAFACKKNYPVYLDETAQLFDVISVSAGLRGLQVLIAPEDYLRVTGARLALLARSKWPTGSPGCRIRWPDRHWASGACGENPSRFRLSTAIACRGSRLARRLSKPGGDAVPEVEPGPQTGPRGLLGLAPKLVIVTA